MKLRAIFATTAVCLAAAITPAHAEIVGKEVTYTDGETNMIGYLAYDDAKEGKRPGVLVVHEWWGHTDYVRKRAEMLAELGYIALAVDMYGDGKTADHPEDAGKFSSEVRNNLPAGEARFKAALELLKAQEQMDPDKVAAIGYCFGGAVVLHMARVGMDLDAVASFHGTLATDNPAQEGKVKARVLVAHGADDPLIPPADVDAFQQEMNDAGVDFKFVSYPGAVHAFTNPGATALGEKFSIPIAYNEAADKASWEELKTLLKEVFGE